MPFYRYKDTSGVDPNEITVIEDKSMFVKDRDGNRIPAFEFIDSRTVKAHPFVIDALIQDCERIWTQDEVLAALQP